MRTLRRVVVAVAVVFAFTACSGGGDDAALPDDPKAALAAAARNTADAESVKMDLTIGAPEGIKLGTGEGAFDFDKKLGRFRLDTTLGLSFDLILTEDKVYLKNSQTSPGAKPWVAVDEDDSTLGFVSQLRGQIDPREALKNIDSTVTDVEKIGTEKIRGANTTHIRGQVDLSDETIAKASEELREGLRTAQQQFGVGGYTIDAWLDDDGRVRRFEYAISLGGSGAGGGGTTTITMDLYGYGEDPEIVVPKPDEVEEQRSSE